MRRPGGDFGADVGLDAKLFGGGVEARRAVDAIDIGERHGGVAVSGAESSVLFGETRAAQKTECRTGVQLDISG